MSVDTTTSRRIAELTSRPRFGPDKHPDWCSRGHRCALGEHRARPVTLTAPRGVIVLVRVMDQHGAQHVEIRTRVQLAPGEPAARAHLANILTELDAHLRRVTRLPR